MKQSRFNLRLLLLALCLAVLLHEVCGHRGGSRRGSRNRRYNYRHSHNGRQDNDDSSTGLIVGIVVGGIAGVCCLIIAFFLYKAACKKASVGQHSGGTKYAPQEKKWTTYPEPLHVHPTSRAQASCPNGEEDNHHPVYPFIVGAKHHFPQPPPYELAVDADHKTAATNGNFKGSAQDFATHPTSHLLLHPHGLQSFVTGSPRSDPDDELFRPPPYEYAVDQSADDTAARLAYYSKALPPVDK